MAFFFFCISFPIVVTKGESVFTIPEQFEQEDFSQVQSLLDETLDEKIDFQQMLTELMTGKIPLEKETVLGLVKGTLLSEMKQNIQAIMYILLIAVLSAVLTNFTKVFEKSQTADIGFYIVYLLLLAVLLNSYKQTQQIAGSVLSQMAEFMKLLVPTYTITIATVQGSTTAAVFYELLLLLICGVQLILCNILLPLSNLYVILNLINYISKEDMVSRLADLVKSFVNWGIHTMLAVVIGLNIVQSLIAPAVDHFKRTTIHKTLMTIPGVGNAMNAVTEAMIGSGILIKNCVGVGILIILVLLCIVPILKLFVCMLLYRFTAAVIQPVSDKRIMECVHTIGEGTGLLMKCVITCLVLFFITIAILTMSTTA